MGISRGIVRLVDPAAFPAWAYQIVSNKCRDSVRRKRRRREATETYSERMQRKERDALTVQEQSNNLNEALEQMSGPDRALLSLRYEEQFDTARDRSRPRRPGRDGQVPTLLREATATQIPGER